jgi:hypothetical protein
MIPTGIDALLARLDDYAASYTGHTDDWQDAAAMIRSLRADHAAAIKSINVYKEAFNVASDERDVARAEAEALRADLARERERVKDYSENSALFLRERDDARAEVAGLRATCFDHVEIQNAIRAEAEALRKDAERYRAIRLIEVGAQGIADYDANVDRMYCLAAMRGKE